ncbi:tetratricopeptide repeat protein [Pseudomonas sp. UBA2684]|uniref:tetratricopeptide repeat protein n=1 Tax=Pseudomonas sp. UBA2684 TaxID=1947311 RepID=UPI0025ED54AF|nr:tetratricopeptide repeat protein [Pseudomonas sp. UBA2684]
MRKPIAVALSLALLGGCESLPEKQQILDTSANFLNKTSAMIAQQAQALSNWGASENNQIYDREIAALFEQPRIDPLSHYLEQHNNDESRARHLRRVLEERERRCENIAGEYAAQAKTAANLSRFSRGYDYSCPAQVQRFAEQIERPTPSSAAVLVSTTATPQPRAHLPAPTASPTASTQLERQQVNNCYLLFTIKNYRQAQDACRAPAEAGDAKAQYKMAVIANALKQYPEALKWARLAAKNTAEGRYQLGLLYYRGHGVEQNHAEALKWYEQAATQGLASAQYQSGRMYAQGQGTAANPRKARSRLSQAANQGHREAQTRLGHMYLAGDGGTADVTSARQWFLKAARQGAAEAQYQLGQMYARGQGVPQNNAEAYVWLSLAEQSGEAQAAPLLERLRPEIDEAQIAQAQQNVRKTLESQR